VTRGLDAHSGLPGGDRRCRAAGETTLAPQTVEPDVDVPEGLDDVDVREGLDDVTTDDQVPYHVYVSEGLDDVDVSEGLDVSLADFASGGSPGRMPGESVEGGGLG
jgi:hypothetical protein